MSEVTHSSIDISFSSLQGIACHQEMVIRHLTGGDGVVSSTQALKEAEIVLDSLDRMVEAHPNFESFRNTHAVFGGRLPKAKA